MSNRPPIPADDTVRGLPSVSRRQDGGSGSARSLLLTVLGEFVLPAGGGPSAPPGPPPRGGGGVGGGEGAHAPARRGARARGPPGPPRRPRAGARGPARPRRPLPG